MQPKISVSRGKTDLSAENMNGEAAVRLHVPARELFWMPPEEPFSKRSVLPQCL